MQQSQVMKDLCNTIIASKGRFINQFFKDDACNLIPVKPCLRKMKACIDIVIGVWFFSFPMVWFWDLI